MFLFEVAVSPNLTHCTSVLRVLLSRTCGCALARLNGKKAPAAAAYLLRDGNRNASGV